MLFIHRVITGARISWASSTAFATLGTALTTLVLLPLLDIAFDVLMGADLASDDLVRTGYAAALTSLTITVASGIVSAVATDRNLGIFQEVCTLRSFDAAYWLAVSIMPTALSTMTAAMSIGAVFALSPAHDTTLLTRVILLAATAAVCGVLLGVSAAGLGVSLPDPYLGATLLAGALPILVGVIVPVSAYPPWLYVLTMFTPLSGTVGVLDGGDFSATGRDLLLAVAWAGAGLTASQIAVRRLRQGVRHHSI